MPPLFPNPSYAPGAVSPTVSRYQVSDFCHPALYQGLPDFQQRETVVSVKQQGFDKGNSELRISVTGRQKIVQTATRDGVWSDTERVLAATNFTEWPTIQQEMHYSSIGL